MILKEESTNILGVERWLKEKKIFHSPVGKANVTYSQYAKKTAI